MEISEESAVTIPIKTLGMIGAALVMATTAYFTLEARITAIEYDREMRGIQVSKNSEFRELWPAGRWGSGSLPADSEQFLRIEAIERDIDELFQLRDEMTMLKIELGKQTKESE